MKDMSFESPQAVAAELKLYTENDGDIYRRMTTSILKNLATKKAQGKYSPDRAVDAFMYLAEEGAKKYAKEMGSPGQAWHDMFPIEARRIAAREWRDEFEQHYAEGEYDTLLPKKYQSGSSLHKQEMARLATMGFYKGERVSMHPATDAFMMGDRYGNVVKVGQKLVHVKMDRSGKIRKVSPGNLEHVY
jgi:hypothetical protein